MEFAVAQVPPPSASSDEKFSYLLGRSAVTEEYLSKHAVRFEQHDKMIEYMLTQHLKMTSGEIWKWAVVQNLAVYSSRLYFHPSLQARILDIAKAVESFPGFQTSTDEERVSLIQKMASICITKRNYVAHDATFGELEAAVRFCREGLETFPHLQHTYTFQASTILVYDALKGSFNDVFNARTAGRDVNNPLETSDEGV